MNRSTSNKDIILMFKEFDIDIQQYLSIAKFFEYAELKLKEAKVEAKKRFKELALELHPDRNPKGEDEFKRLSNLMTTLEQIKLQQPRPVQQVIRVVHYSSTNMYNSTSSASTTNYTSTRGGW